MNTIERVWTGLNLFLIGVGAFAALVAADNNLPTDVALLLGVAAVGFVNVVVCFIGHITKWRL